MAPVKLQTETPVDFAPADAVIDTYGADKSWLVMILQDIQEAYNYLPQPVLEHVARRLELAPSHVYRVATFYASFSLTRRGKHLILICDGTACHLRGAENLQEQLTRQLGVAPGQTTADELFTLETVACLGACALAPVMMIDGKYFGKLTSEKIVAALKRFDPKEAADA